MIAAYYDISNNGFKQDCVHIPKYINKRMVKKFDVRAIVKRERDQTSHQLCMLNAEVPCCQSTSATVERSFSVGKVVTKR